MARPGPLPANNRIGHSPQAEWTDVRDEPYIEGEARDLPDSRTWNPQTLQWWGVLRTMPHARLWREGDWLAATDLAILKNAFYLGTATAGEVSEMRTPRSAQHGRGGASDDPASCSPRQPPQRPRRGPGMRQLIRAAGHRRANGLGALAVAWVEFFCVHGPGDILGTPLDPDLDGALPLDDEFAGFIMDCYAVNTEGRRLYTSAFLSRAKGRAKSELAAFIVLFEALGPCRVARGAFGEPLIAQGGEIFEAGGFVWEYAVGDFIAAPIVNPVIRCLATEEGQAGNTYDNVYENFLNSVRLQEAYGITRSGVGLTGIKLPAGGEIIPSTASGAAKDGGKETFAVFDETHLYVLPELHRMYATVSRNLDKRQAAEPWALETSTMYAPGEDSVAEQTYDQARAILEGLAFVEDTLIDHRQADPDVDIYDPESLEIGLIEAYGEAASWMDIKRMVSKFFDKRRKVADQRRYFLNLPTSTSDAWLDATAWERCAKPAARLKPRDQITLGFDGSQKRARGMADATALVACRVSDGLLVPIDVWEQPEGPEGVDWSVDTEDVNDAVAEAFRTYRVVGFYADPPLWQETVIGWEAKYGAQLAVKAATFPIQWWTNRTTLMGRALDLFEGAVNDEELTHGGHPTLTRHILNAKRRPVRGSMAIAKEHKDSARKIDAAMAAVLAFQARADFLAGGSKLKTRRKFAVATTRR
ncbi:hypothetical protein Q3G72_008320 [Acer saccharum]|nr:hypothetical protein Q3G72_008320 [Acer saccharum]